MRGRIALGAVVIARLVMACVDGVTPDCTTNPAVCNYIEGDAGPLPVGKVDAGKDGASDAAADATVAADAADAADGADGD